MYVIPLACESAIAFPDALHPSPFRFVSLFMRKPSELGLGPRAVVPAGAGGSS